MNFSINKITHHSGGDSAKGTRGHNDTQLQDEGKIEIICGSRHQKKMQYQGKLLTYVDAFIPIGPRELMNQEKEQILEYLMFSTEKEM